MFPTDTSLENGPTLPGAEATPPYWIAVVIGAGVVGVATLTVAVAFRQVPPLNSLPLHYLCFAFALPLH